jgi:hypothetical protein
MGRLKRYVKQRKKAAAAATRRENRRAASDQKRATRVFEAICELSTELHQEKIFISDVYDLYNVLEQCRKKARVLKVNLQIIATSSLDGYPLRWDPKSPTHLKNPIPRDTTSVWELQVEGWEGHVWIIYQEGSK